MKKLILLLFVLFCHRCDAQNVASYSRYDNYSCVDFDQVPGFFVPTLQDCVAYSTVSPLTNGVVYQDAENVCKLLTNSNNSILIRLHVKTGWTTFVKNTSATYQLVFKTDANIPGLSDFTSNLWNNTASGYTTTYTPQVASLNRSNSCSCVYRNEYIDYWNTLQAKMVYFDGGLPVVELIFDSRTTKTDWFTQARLISSVPYSLSSIRLTNFASILPFSLLSTTFPRWFAPLRTDYGTNCNWDSFIGVLSMYNGCSFGEASAYPIISYSLTASASSLNNSALQGKADMLMVFIKSASSIAFVP